MRELLQSAAIELVILSPIWFIRQALWEKWHRKSHQDIQSQLKALQDQLGHISIAMSELTEKRISEQDKKVLRLVLAGKEPHDTK